MNADHFELCTSLLDNLKAHEHYQYFSAPAVSALSPEEGETYLKVISNPMDLGTVETKLVAGKYTSIAAFREDVNLCFENSKTFCKKRYPAVHDIALNMQKYFRTQFDKAMSKLSTSSAHSNENKSQEKESSGQPNTKRSKRSLPATATVAVVPIEIEPAFEGEVIATCEKIMNDIMNLNELTKTLQRPIDLVAYSDYPTLIRHPVYFDLILDRIRGRAKEPPKKYSTINQFSLDMRRLFSNFIIYNYVFSSARYRKQIITALTKFEQRWREVITSTKLVIANAKIIEPLPEVIPCIEAIDNALKAPSASGEGFAIDGFMYSVDTMLDEDMLRKYKAVISKPVHFGYIVQKLIEAEYRQLDEVKEDVRLVASNCEIFWKIHGSDVERTYIDNAKVLESTFMKSLEERLSKTPNQNIFPAIAVRPVESASTTVTDLKGSKARPTISSSALASLSSLSSSIPQSTIVATPSASEKPIIKRTSSVASSISKEESIASIQRRMNKFLPNLLRRAVEEVKKHYLMSTSIENLKIMTARPFLKAVDPVHFPDYHTIVSNPMDLGRVEKKISGNRYENIKAILDDITLIRDNAYAYNTDKESIEVPIMADALLDYFKHLIRTAIADLYTAGDDNLANMLADDSIQEILRQPDSETVLKYLAKVEEETGTRPHFKVDAPIVVAPPPIAANSLSKKPTHDNSSILGSVSNAAWDVASSIGGDEPMDNDDSSSIFMISSKKSGKNRTSTTSASNQAIGLSPSIQMFSPMPSVVIRDKMPWEITCEKMLNSIIKHPYVDLKSTSVVANFHIPIVEVYPHLAEEYLRVIKEPMDLTTLRTRLDGFSILDAEDFYNMAVRIFQNALDYNDYQRDQAEKLGLLQGGEDRVFQYRSIKYKHLTQYIKWLGLELFNEILTNDIGKEHAEKLGNLRVSLQEKGRKDREEWLKPYQIDRSTSTSPASGIRDCDRLLKALRKFANNSEKQQIEHFQLPFDESLLADYYVYVRKPMDMATIKYKLDGALPKLGTKPEEIAIMSKIKHSKFYSTFGEFLDDLRRVFDNAIKYNGPHRLTDNTGVSQRVYDAAIFMQERLERLIPEFTLSLYDKLERRRIKREEEYERYERKRSRNELVEQSVAEFEAQEKEKLLAEDIYYAADMDAERKKELTRQQLIASRLAKKQQLEEMSKSKLGYVDEELFDVDAYDLDNNVQSSSSLPQTTFDSDEVIIGPDGNRLTAYEAHLLDERRLQRWKDHLRIPMQFVRVLDMKRKLREVIWKRWEPYAIKKQKSIVRSTDESNATIPHATTSSKINDSVDGSSSHWIEVDNEETEIKTKRKLIDPIVIKRRADDSKSNRASRKSVLAAPIFSDV